MGYMDSMEPMDSSESIDSSESVDSSESIDSSGIYGFSMESMDFSKSMGFHVNY